MQLINIIINLNIQLVINLDMQLLKNHEHATSYKPKHTTISKSRTCNYLKILNMHIVEQIEGKNNRGGDLHMRDEPS